MTLRLTAATASVVALLILLPQELGGWGFWAHRQINRFAIESLPAEMLSFFRLHADTIIARSVEPDNRRYVDSAEAYFHYIDIDRYGAYPFEELPRSYEEAVQKFGKVTVDTNGTVPWRIVDFTRRLTDAMRRKNTRQIVFFASNLGHYIADAHVPLHTTENYDGQFTNQRGIHSRWESRIPEKFGRRWNLGPGEIKYIDDQLEYAFAIVLESYSKVDSVLSLDIAAREGLKDSEVYRVIQRRGRREYEYSDLYYERYLSLLNNMVERRIRDSIRRVASYWYTAWVDAGKPELPLD